MDLRWPRCRRPRPLPPPSCPAGTAWRGPRPRGGAPPPSSSPAQEEEHPVLELLCCEKYVPVWQGQVLQPAVLSQLSQGPVWQREKEKEKRELWESVTTATVRNASLCDKGQCDRSQCDRSQCAWQGIGIHAVMRAERIARTRCTDKLTDKLTH